MKTSEKYTCQYCNIGEIQIFCSPLSVMPEVGQCLFTGKAISPRQTTICRPAPSQQQCNLPTAHAVKKEKETTICHLAYKLAAQSYKQ